MGSSRGKKISILLILIIAIGLLFFYLKDNPSLFNGDSGAQSARPFPYYTDYSQDTNFPSNYGSEDFENAIYEYYLQWNDDYLIKVDSDPAQYRISFGKGREGQTVSEGQGYGMLIFSLIGDRDAQAHEIFDGLYRFVKAHPSKIDDRLMAWIYPEGDSGQDCAFDGDADIALALIIAHEQWGDGGEFNYLEEAKKRITALMESVIGPHTYLPLLGDWVDPQGDKYNESTPRSSDFMLANFKAFENVMPEQPWDKVIEACKNIIVQFNENISENTGFLPDFIVPSGDGTGNFMQAPPNFLEGPYDGAYYYNAGRDPWRIGSYALITGDDELLGILEKMSNWIMQSTQNDPAKIKAGYWLDGAPLPNSDYYTNFFVAPFGIACMANPDASSYLDSLVSTIMARHTDYYEDSVTLLSLFVLSGTFWIPD